MVTAWRWLLAAAVVPLVLAGCTSSTGPPDEGSGTAACCGENSGLGPSHPSVPLPGKTGPGGGRIGSVLLSPLIRPGIVSTVPYNHYSLLRTIEDISACRTWATRPCRRPGLAVAERCGAGVRASGGGSAAEPPSAGR